MNQTKLILLILFNSFFWLLMLFIGYGFKWEFPPFSTADGSFYPSMLWGNFFNAVIVYTNALLLFPLRKKIMLPYWLTASLLVIGISILEAGVDYYLVDYLELGQKIDKVFEGEEDSPRAMIMVAWVIQNIVIHTLWLLVSFTLVYFLHSFQKEEELKILKAEKIQSELNYLKAQINPHFLFNGINSVYFLIDQAPEKAKATLLRFSDLLRYQLYECKDDFIPLAKELAYIKDFVAMEQIRRGEDVQIRLRIPDEVAPELMIAPLLFTPFIENAFKYISNLEDGADNQIRIEINQQAPFIHFSIHNTTDVTKPTSNGGIGIPNVKKRLQLIYPDKHQLIITDKEDYFKVNLSIKLWFSHKK